MYSAKIAQVADVLPINLQLFAEDSAEGDIDSIFDESEDVNEEPSETSEGDNAEKDSGAADPEKQAQDAETNKAFATMRRQIESYERQMKKADELVSNLYGETHGIKNMKDYMKEQARIEEEERRQMLIEKGLDPEEVQNIIDNHPAIKEAREYRDNMMLWTQYQEL
jgi:uncharacterized protein YneF (UPF0154 family)